MCIYLVDSQNLHYDSAEHIIPAGLSGMQKLPFDFVSREFNNVSSRQEMAFLRSSILAVPRQILGPGKRGSLSPGKATKFVVNVFSQQRSGNDLTLGYIQAGVPVEIPTVRWDALCHEFTVNIAKASTGWYTTSTPPVHRPGIDGYEAHPAGNNGLWIARAAQ